MDWGLFWTVIGTVSGATIGIITFIYQIFRNFKSDSDQKFENFERKFEGFERRFEGFERRFEMLENRIFQLAMGKSLKQILLEERETDK